MGASMILVERFSITPPERFRLQANADLERLMVEYRGSGFRVNFRGEIWRQVKPNLMELFHGKCAYCESQISHLDFGDVQHLRPKGSVQENSIHSGYYWLAYEWENLLLLCSICGANKRNKFPLIVEADRAFGPNDPLEKEQPLLLDPCHDDPTQHLHFATDSGLIEPLTDRGEATVELVGLNRAALVAERARRIQSLRRELRSAASLSDLELAELLREFVANPAPYAAFARAALDEWLAKQNARLTTRIRAILERDYFEVGDKPLPGAAPTLLALSKDPRESHNPRTGNIQRIEIENFKAIRSLSLDLEATTAAGVGWKVFLGENGAGKSSILEAVALVLAGEDGLSLLDTQPEIILRRPRRHGRRPQEGAIRVWLSTDVEPLELRFSNSRWWFKSGREGSRTLVRGYGATRLLSSDRNAHGESQAAGDGRDVRNLFHPFHRLCNVERWLQGLDDRGFGIAAITLRDILSASGQDFLFSRRGGLVRASDASGVPVPLHQLSKGQQATLALAGDIMWGVMGNRAARGFDPIPGDFGEEAGIVLLDEIDAHLHPRWKMKIVPHLRKAFPYMQFLATTHEPLCLRGLDAGEIVVMRRSETGIAAELVQMSPAGWRVDQLLTSSLFGLNSTIDPDVEVQFQEYYELLRTPDDGLSDGARARRDFLRRALQVHNKLGYTRRDQFIYEVIDEYLAKEVALSPGRERLGFKEETKQRILNIWRRVSAARGENDSD